ncbi:cilia- and flagella-associated protein 52-like [Columba livia]|uniref:cilia- and flagella-associated protein 52-like n=1 Tax=Columba livia TaxID=8932 RepID=UPI0031BAE68E
MVWDVSKREAVCGSPASPRSAGNANVVMCSSCRDEVFVTAGNFTIRVWELDTATKTIHPSECYAGQLRGITVCVQMTDDDGDFHLGTTSGDVLKVNTSSKVLTACGPQKKKLSMVSSSSVTPILSLSCSLLVTEGRATCGRTITKRILRLTLFLRCQERPLNDHQRTLRMLRVVPRCCN